MGGEEFAVLLPYSSESAARSLFARLRQALETLNIPGMGEPVRLSAGLALLGPDDTSLEALRARADTALYQAKAEAVTAGAGSLHRNAPCIPCPGRMTAPLLQPKTCAKPTATAPW
jgi:GGDEF domain-containing protein